LGISSYSTRFIWGIWRPSAIVYSAVTPWTEQPDMEKESWTYIFWLIDGQILTVNA
jgi:hypothetical protein